MFKDIYKRLGIQILIYLVIMYLIPWVSIEFFGESIRDVITALFFGLKTYSSKMLIPL